MGIACGEDRGNAENRIHNIADKLVLHPVCRTSINHSQPKPNESIASVIYVSLGKRNLC